MLFSKTVCVPSKFFIFEYFSGKFPINFKNSSSLNLLFCSIIKFILNTKLSKKFDSLDFQTDDITKILQINDSILPKKLKEDLIEKLDFNLISNDIIASLVYKYMDMANEWPIEKLKRFLIF